MVVVKYKDKVARYHSSVITTASIDPIPGPGEVYFDHVKYNYVYIPYTGLEWITTNLSIDLKSVCGDFDRASVWYAGQGKGASLEPVPGYDEYGKLYCNTPEMRAELDNYLHDGWRLPTYSEARSLITASGGDWKAISSTTGWSDENGTNSLGLNLQPCGDCYGRTCDGYGSKGTFWTSTASNNTGYIVRYYYLSVNQDHYPIFYTDNGSGNGYLAIRLCRTPPQA